MQADELGIFSLEALDQIGSHLINDLKHVPYVVASGSANTYTATLTPAPPSYVDGMPIAVKINATNTGASTINVNGLGARPIKDSRGNAMSSGRLNANIIYTMRYEATNGNFILMGEGSGGTATAGEVLNGKTFTNDSGPQIGTMTNKVGVGLIITPNTVDQAIPQGYYGGAVGDGKCIGDADLVSANILSGINIFGVSGSVIPVSSGPHGSQTFTSSGTFTVPTNVYRIFVLACGGGGGGSKCYNYYGGPGASGFFCVGVFQVTPGSQYTVIIGAGGAGDTGGMGGGSNAQPGGDTSLGTLIKAGGGYGGTGGTEFPGTPGSNYSTSSGYLFGTFEKGIMISYGISSTGGSSIFGSGGVSGTSPTAGGIGSGGGAVTSGTANGASGGPGKLVIWW